MDAEQTFIDASKIASCLLASEDAIEEALSSVAAMITLMPQIKRSASLTIFHGQEVIETSQELIEILASSRRKIAQLHRKLELTQHQIGLQHFAFGPVGKPSAEENHPAMRDIRQVA